MTMQHTNARSLALLRAVVFIAVICRAGMPALAEPRSARVAGRFYPSERVELLNAVSRLLDSQPQPQASDKPRMLIVPHAGYAYSGLVAARAFKQLSRRAYDGVVIVAFTHRVQFDGASVDTRESYRTPLGELSVDQQAAAFLQTYPGIRHIEEAHETDEHSLEVELPFLQVALGEPRIVPILMGSADPEDAQRLAEALAALSRRGDYLFIFSSDLSHYHPAEEAEARDELTVNAILAETPAAVAKLFERGDMEACGRGPILASLLLAERLGYPRKELLAYAHSGSTAGDRSSVVGYAAIAMYDRPAEAAGRLSPEAGAALLQAARHAARAAVQGADAPQPVDTAAHPELGEAAGLFVTLRKGGILRGCIGRIEAGEPLAGIVSVVAAEAALHDPRFSPVRPEELDSLQVEVSVLTPPIKLNDPRAIVAGRDGIILEHEGHRGILLPQVWKETGWTRLEFLRALASEKAGLNPDAWQHAILYAFQDQAFQEASQP